VIAWSAKAATKVQNERTPYNM